MTLVIDVESDGVRTPVSRTRLRAIAESVLRAEKVRHAMLSVTLVSTARIAKLNRTHLGHAGPTDVISFALGSADGRSPAAAVVGDVYIAPAVARAYARRFGASVREEVERLVVHGTLHVLGYDHPDGDDRVASPMWRRQERLLRAARRPGRAAATRRT